LYAGVSISLNALYVLEIIVIARQGRKTFKCSVYRIFCALAIVNIAAYIFGTFAFRMPLYPTFNLFYSTMQLASWWLTALNSFTHYLNCLSEILGLLLAINIFSVLYCPTRHDEFWRRRSVHGVLVCLLVSLVPVWPLIDDVTAFHEVNNDPLPGDTWYYLDATSDAPESSIVQNTAIVTVGCNAVSALLYAACLVRIYLDPVNRDYSAERRLLMLGCLTTLCSLPYMSTILYSNLTEYMSDGKIDLTTFMFFRLPWLTDLKFLSPAPALLLTNSSIRQSITNMLFDGRSNIMRRVSKERLELLRDISV
ncbi:hypothetical protein PENTCL1PPCAC_14252, partial [Pristionchus entomophagus]